MQLLQSPKDPTMSTVTLKWTVPTLYNDGTTPLPPAMIDHADIFDSASNTPATPIGTVQGAVGTFTTGVLTVGAHNFTVETTDTNGHESTPSNVFTANILPVSALLPAAVTDLSGTVNTGTGTTPPTGPVLATADNPATGPVAGGTSVTITGADLTGATSVTFGGKSATSILVSADGTTLTAVTPAGVAGKVDIVIVTPNGTATLPQSFTYV
jgi:hypothetical protein